MMVVDLIHWPVKVPEALKILKRQSLLMLMQKRFLIHSHGCHINLLASHDHHDGSQLLVSYMLITGSSIVPNSQLG